MSKAFFPLSLSAAIIFALPSIAHAALIAFDDISVAAGTAVALTSPYAGLNWSGVEVENHLLPSRPTSSGFRTGIVSQTNAADGVDVTFTAVTGTFTFTSGYFTKAFGGFLPFGQSIPNTESITVSDNLGDSKIFTTNKTAPTFETFDWAGVTTISISAASTYVFDNLTLGGISPGSGGGAPEPSTWAMLLIGFAGLSFASYRGSRRRAATPR